MGIVAKRLLLGTKRLSCDISLVDFNGHVSVKSVEKNAISRHGVTGYKLNLITNGQFRSFNCDLDTVTDALVCRVHLLSSLQLSSTLTLRFENLTLWDTGTTAAICDDKCEDHKHHEGTLDIPGLVSIKEFVGCGITSCNTRQK